MKCKLVDVKPDFQPVTLNITFESQDEIDGFYTVFNNPCIARWINEYSGVELFDEIIRDGIKPKTSDTHETTEIHRKFYKSLKEEFNR